MKAQVTIVDLIDKSFTVDVVEGTDPVDCYIQTVGGDDEGFRSLYQQRLKVNGEEVGEWVIDCDDGLILIKEV